jgi:acylphosphatase
MKTVRMAVRGNVQGGGFRDWIVRQARSLEVAGWVQNRSDDSVEILASGEASGIERLAQAAHRGPPFARVSEVTVEDAEADEAAPGFVQRPTL